ncbi:MAG: Gfo/Idh/MocA family oxidoreductase, partial [Elusimicrobiota bacterium]
MDKINVAVIGVGNLGQHHARIYSEIEDVILTAVVDINEKALKKISSLYNTSAFRDFHEILDKVEAVSVVTPTVTHYSIAKEIIECGIHCFIEKPITTKLTDAEDLIELSANKNVVLQVGHIERFNSAIVGIQKYVKNPGFIEVDRLGPYDSRVSDVGVVLDLMIHDLDIVMSLVKSKIKNIEAHGASIFSAHEDIVKVRLWFENGCVADLTASRATMGKYRKIRIFQPEMYICADYKSQRFKVYRKKNPNPKSMNDIEVIHPEIERTEPLKQELLHFIECARHSKTPLVSGEHGRNALEVALEILKQIQKHA